MNKTLNFLFLGLAWLSMQPLPAQSLKLNESGYFDGGGVNVMVFNNPYHSFFYDEKRSGIDIIHRGVLTASNGCVRLQNTPEQWDLVPETVSHKVDVDRQTVSVVVDYPDYGFQPEMRVSPRGKGFAVEVWLSQPVPKFLEGKAGFNLEFLPSAYWQRSFLIDGRPDYFPRYPGGNMVMRPTSEKVKQVLGYTTYDDRGRGEFPVPRPFAQGHRLVLAPEDADRCVKIESDSTLLLFDGRQVAQNGWYVVRSLLPAGATGKVLEWYVEPKVAEGWTRKPNIGFSQVGYEPSQNKQTIIELDKADTPLPTVTLLQIDAEGHSTAVAELPAKLWGRFRRYQYVTADFSSHGKKASTACAMATRPPTRSPSGEVSIATCGIPQWMCGFPYRWITQPCAKPTAFGMASLSKTTACRLPSTPSTSTTTAKAPPPSRLTGRSSTYRASRPVDGLMPATSTSRPHPTMPPC